MDKPKQTRSLINHLDLVHLDQQRPEIHHALHKEVYQRDHLSKPKTLPSVLTIAENDLERTFLIKKSK